MADRKGWGRERVVEGGRGGRREGGRGEGEGLPFTMVAGHEESATMAEGQQDSGPRSRRQRSKSKLGSSANHVAMVGFVYPVSFCTFLIMFFNPLLHGSDPCCHGFCCLCF